MSVSAPIGSLLAQMFCRAINEVEMSVAKKKEEREGGLYDTVKVIFQALLIAVVIRTFLFQPFNIPSASMVETLLVGDYLFVSKYSYGYSQYSFPFGIVPIPGRILGSQPERGDIAVFKLPRDNATDYIKRVIGLPGDRAGHRDGGGRLAGGIDGDDDAGPLRRGDLRVGGGGHDPIVSQRRAVPQGRMTRSSPLRLGRDHDVLD